MHDMLSIRIASGERWLPALFRIDRKNQWGRHSDWKNQKMNALYRKLQNK